MNEDQMNPQPEPQGNFDGHPTQAHADHATIMKAHSIISDPQRMEAVHALHKHSGGLMEYLKKKKQAFDQKSKAPAEGAEPPMPESGAEMNQ